MTRRSCGGWRDRDEIERAITNAKRTALDKVVSPAVVPSRRLAVAETATQ